MTHFGQQKFNQSLKVTYKKNQEFSVILRNVEESTNLYLTLVFMDTKGEIQSGPLFSSEAHTVFILIILSFSDREIQFHELSTFEGYCQINGLETVPLKLDYW